mgnify:CR=1 FL=1
MKITNTILDQIIEHKKGELEKRKKEFSIEIIKEKISQSNFFKSSFKESLKKNKIALIAEIKKVSPSMGLIKDDFDHKKIAKNYFDYGASAISVLTDQKYFQGDIKFIGDIKKIVPLPVLRKDFIFDEYQIYESKANGADAILLIASILTKDELKKLIEIADSLDLDCLVETHSYTEIEIAIEAGAQIIGINNRDLKTFNIDINNFLNLSRFIPDDKIIVCESGIFSRPDVLKAKYANADAVLVGTSLMTCENMENKMMELIV